MRSRPALIAIVCIFLAGMAATAQEIPPAPADGSFVSDYAGLLGPEALRDIGQLQSEAYLVYDTPIVVVTIPGMSAYGAAGYPIDGFTRMWFDRWGIGKRKSDGTLVNRGMLLLVSVGDRQARIELGAEWGTRWDYRAERIMLDSIVPRFKKGDYAGGILEGVQGLRDMAAQGPEASPPAPGMLEKIRHAGDRSVGTSLFPNWLVALLVIAGAGLIVLSFVFPQHRKVLLIAGISILLLGIFTYIIFLVVALVLRLLSRRSAGGGFASTGAFGTGGFSGGGGATGSW